MALKVGERSLEKATPAGAASSSGLETILSITLNGKGADVGQKGPPIALRMNH